MTREETINLVYEVIRGLGLTSYISMEDIARELDKITRTTPNFCSECGTNLRLPFVEDYHKVYRNKLRDANPYHVKPAGTDIRPGMEL